MPMPSVKKRKSKAVPLPTGTEIEHYRVRQVLGFGGFSVVYTADDLRSGHIVAIKEYYSTKCVGRRSDFTLSLLSPELSSQFNTGMRRFFDEGHTLSRMSHPNIVGVRNFFRANGTAYMVMNYEVGRDLRWFIKKSNELPDEAFLLAVFIMVLAGLQQVHDRGFLHLDIKPSNIFLRASGYPLLLDLGAAHKIRKHGHAPKIQTISHGYSSPEQHDRGALSVVSDIYALAMTMRACITHSTPQSASRRFEKDQLRPLEDTHRKFYRPGLLQAIDAASSLEPNKRPEDIDAFIRMLTAR